MFDCQNHALAMSTDIQHLSAQKLKVRVICAQALRGCHGEIEANEPPTLIRYILPRNLQMNHSDLI